MGNSCDHSYLARIPVFGSGGALRGGGGGGGGGCFLFFCGLLLVLAGLLFLGVVGGWAVIAWDFEVLLAFS